MELPEYRAWDTDEKKMYTEEEYGEFPKFFYDTSPVTGYDGSHIPDNIILMEYTGRKDSYGKKIFDGDILEYSCTIISGDKISEPREDKHISPVSWGKFGDGEYVENIECWIWNSDSLTESIDSQSMRDKMEQQQGFWCIIYNNFWKMKGGKYKVIGNIHQNPELLKQ